MIGMKELNLVNTGRKVVNKYKKNFSGFTEGNFYVYISLVDPKTEKFVKVIELEVNSDNLMDYLENAIDLKDYKVSKMIFSTTKK